MRIVAFALALLTMGASCVPLAARAQTAFGSQRIGGKRFEVLAKRALASVATTGDEELVQAFPIQDQIVDAGKTSLIVESPLVTPSFVNVPIQIQVDGAFVRTLFVGYRVQQFVRTAVAAHDLVAGTVIEPGDVTIARVPSTGRMSNGTKVLVGRKLIAAFRKGQPVFIEETQTNQIVKPGSSVVLIVNDGGVSVVAEAVARTGGGLGDEVSVYNPSTNKTLSGTVVGPDRVQLDILGVTH
jgi:flagella basal body P-ring formation protein FlgA